MESLCIRPASPENAEALLAFLRQIGGESNNLTFGPEGLPFTAEQERAYLQALQLAQDSVMLCAWAGAQLVGIGSANRLSRRMRHRAELSVAVAKSEWGQGVGSQLLEALIQWARRHEIAILNLEVRSDNDRAVRLYKKFGFQTIGTSPAFFQIGGEDIDFTLMYLDLR